MSTTTTTNDGMLIEEAKRQLRGRRLSVVLPETEDVRIVEAAGLLAAADLARPILLSPTPIAGFETIDPETSDRREDYVRTVVAARGSLSPAMAARLLARPLHFGAAMVAVGDADAMVAGVMHPTRRVIEAGLMTIGLAEGIATPSSSFVMRLPDNGVAGGRMLVFADCAVNADPTAEELADIAIASAETCRRLLGETPRIAMLSFSTHGSASQPKVEKVRKAVAIVGARRPDILCDGELQGDAALDPRIAARKVKLESAVAGQANVLVFPDLDAGNIAYKLVQQLAGAQAIGPLLQGFARPISDLSRGASVEDIIATVVMTLIRSADFGLDRRHSVG